MSERSIPKRGDPTYRAKCACGWTSKWGETVGRAQQASGAHLRHAPPYKYEHGTHIQMRTK